ncbi:hypothetical protein RY831_03325 [Noviherbaspirillum sp. CPCC 100848]|uniref:Peptidase C39-like domain-containing protein n=1 Tax=Noviherbaspirillum album TaxID=3080276 RepID=A0ABU6J3F1_9BURK|nr:hypothetical protein [Noviherbaspirillum sp. CPCC 100848]MEC4718164.1 hypothetical protein [Noviherbaspirillum sp. CPCC 100848]
MVSNIKKHYTKDDPRTVDCFDWAVEEAVRLQKIGVKDVKFLFMKSAVPGASFLGPYLLPIGVWYSPDAEHGWQHHYAVVANGVVRDECYSWGVSLYEYMTTVFEYYDGISFMIMTEPNGHL